MAKADDDLDAATTQVPLHKSAPRGDVGSVLADLEEHSSVGASISTAAKTQAEQHPPRLAAGNFLLALLVLIAAGGAAAVVYFALPYLT